MDSIVSEFQPLDRKCGMVFEDDRSYTRALGRYATGVAIVTTHSAPRVPIGLTVNSFASVSLSPRLVSWCLKTSSSMFKPFTMASQFAINVLSAEQVDLSRRFATNVENRFQDVRYRVGEFACPVIEGVVASFECQMAAQHLVGDHILFIGEVLGFRHVENLSPLVFHSGEFLHA